MSNIVILYILSGLDNPLSYGHQLARKDQVVRWLRTACGQKIEKELTNSSNGSVRTI